MAASSISRPIILMGMLGREFIAFAGKPAKMMVPYTASPRPDITWSRNGIPLEKRDVRAEIETTTSLTMLNYKKCERVDSGDYTIKVGIYFLFCCIFKSKIYCPLPLSQIHEIQMENDMGSDSIKLCFKVVDNPSPPEGPLIADDICSKSCKLSWKSPKNDGGSSINNYIVKKYMLDSDMWEKTSSIVRNTNCLVTDLVENERYKFRVFAQSQYGLSEPLEMSNPITAKCQLSIASPPEKPICRDTNKTWAEVEWEPPASNGGSEILGYNLQYRKSHSCKWLMANSELITDTRYKMANVEDQGEYEVS